MSETTPQDDAAMPPASTGSVEPVAWAVLWENDERFDRTTVSFTEAAARRHAANCPSMKGTIVALYRHSHATVLLRRATEDFEISEANGYAAAIEDFKRALTEAGVGWVE